MSNVDTILCSQCGLLKNKIHFKPTKSRRSGFTWACKPCVTNYNRKRSKKRATIKREEQLKLKYGITNVDYENLFQSQNGKCAICARDHTEFSRNLAVDHNHVSKKIRGLLCGSCNTAIGLFRESETNLIAAINYLKSNKD